MAIEPEPDDILIADLARDGRLSTRAKNCLIYACNPYCRSIFQFEVDFERLTVGRVAQASDSELMRITNMGRRTIFEIRLVCGPLPPQATEKADERARRILRKEWVDAVRNYQTDLSFSEWTACNSGGCPDESPDKPHSTKT